MVFPSFFKGRAAEAINKFSGNKDYLEGMCAICALTAAAKGGIDDAEYDKTLKVIMANTAISAAFAAPEVESIFGKMTAKTGTRSGKSELKNEIREVIARDKTGTMGRAMMLAALDVADEGGIEPEETAVLKDLATICNVNYDKLLAE